MLAQHIGTNLLIRQTFNGNLTIVGCIAEQFNIVVLRIICALIKAIGRTGKHISGGLILGLYNNGIGELLFRCLTGVSIVVCDGKDGIRTVVAGGYLCGILRVVAGSICPGQKGFHFALLIFRNFGVFILNLKAVGSGAQISLLILPAGFSQTFDGEFHLDGLKGAVALSGDDNIDSEFLILGQILCFNAHKLHIDHDLSHQAFIDHRKGICGIIIEGRVFRRISCIVQFQLRTLNVETVVSRPGNCDHPLVGPGLVSVLQKRRSSHRLLHQTPGFFLYTLIQCNIVKLDLTVAVGHAALDILPGIVSILIRLLQQEGCTLHRNLRSIFVADIMNEEGCSAGNPVATIGTTAGAAGTTKTIICSLFHCLEQIVCFCSLVGRGTIVNTLDALSVFIQPAAGVLLGIIAHNVFYLLAAGHKDLRTVRVPLNNPFIFLGCVFLDNILHTNNILCRHISALSLNPDRRAHSILGSRNIDFILAEQFFIIHG